jgi:serine/threonine protein kinase
MPRLLCQAGSSIGEDYPVTDEMTLGRTPENSVVVQDPKASRKHLKLFKEAGAYFIEDLGSANGTYLNEVKITKVKIAYGDRIRIGRTTFQFLADPEQSLEGRVIGPYTIEKKIGPRGIGIVYKAKQAVLDRDVAVKVLDKDYADDPEFVERFISESRQAGKVHHPGVIQVFDVGKAGDWFFVSMEWISGKPLRDEIPAKPTFPFADALRITREVADAMAEAHAQGIPHKELTPSNIILTTDRAAKVAELGITKENRLEKKDIKTLYYISPEEARGMTPNDRSDIYTLGIVLYQMLAGDVPFRAETTAEIIQMHAKSPIPDVRDARPDAPDALAKLVSGMCAKLPKDRVQSMSEVVETLKVIEEHLKAKARAPRPAVSDAALPKVEQRIEEVKKKSQLGLGIEIGIAAVVCIMLFFICELLTQIFLGMLY